MRKYDIAMTHQLDADDFFIHRVQENCARLGLNFFLIEPLWVEPFLKHLTEGRAGIGVLLNLHSEHHQPTDPFHRLVRAADRMGTRVVDPPDVAAAAFDKARLHRRLQEAGFHLPFTLVVPQERASSLDLSPLDLANLGQPFVIKPAMGYGKRGVVLDATGPSDLARSMAEWPGSHYLLQRKVTPRRFDQGPAYFRIFHAFGSVWCCWWNCYTDQYRPVSEAEMETLGLHPLREISHRLASLTDMRFFSTEVAITESGEFLPIDYVNDQCHMLTQSANPRMGVPDEVVAAIADRLVDAAAAMLRPPPAAALAA